MNWPWIRRTVVLGTELAKAQEAEDVRLASGTAIPSPLSDDVYDFENGDYNLTNVSALPLDLKLRELTNDFIDSSADERFSLNSDDLYTLINFVKRCSVLALNNEAITWCRAGLTALMMIDETRVDWRDVRWAAGLLANAVGKYPGVARSLQEGVGILPRSASHFLRETVNKSSLDDWGYAEIRTYTGIGLIQHGFADYRPTIDLTEIALETSKWLSKDRYVAEVEIAVDVPEVWFGKNNHDDAKNLLRRVVGAALIRGSLRKLVNASGPQMFTTWLAEMPHMSDSRQLVDLVGSGTPLSGRYSTGLYHEKLFALLVAGSAQEGVESYETPASLAQLAEGVRFILAHNAIS